MEQLVINKDKKTVSPPNPLPIPDKGQKDYVEKMEAYNEAQNALPIYPIKESVCKSGMVISATVLAYHAGDKREGIINEDNSVTLHGPYK